MKYWLIILLFDVNGDFRAKDIFETGKLECVRGGSIVTGKQIGRAHV